VRFVGPEDFAGARVQRVDVVGTVGDVDRAFVLERLALGGETGLRPLNIAQLPASDATTAAAGLQAVRVEVSGVPPGRPVAPPANNFALFTADDVVDHGGGHVADSFRQRLLCLLPSRRAEASENCLRPAL
jgi:hypothetical protein